MCWSSQGQPPSPKNEECRKALKARRALNKRVWHSRELRGETISAFRRSQAKARRLFNQKKRQSWAEYVSKLSAETPIKHVWDRVRKISGKNICPSKQYLNGKNGTTITDPKDEPALVIEWRGHVFVSAVYQATVALTEIKEIPVLNQSWRGCNHPTSIWPHQGHQVPYLVPRTTECLSPLWWNTQHWSYAPGVCSGTGMSWRILHSWLIEYPLWDNSRHMHSGIPVRSGILLSDMTQLT